MDNKHKNHNNANLDDIDYPAFINAEKWLLIVFFIVLIIIPPLINILTPDKAYSESENRYLQKAPVISIKSLSTAKFMQEFENYNQDQFYARDAWVRFKTLIERLLLKQDSKGLFFGAKNYFLEEFTKPDPKIFKSNMEGINNFSDYYTDNIKIYMLTTSSSVDVLKHLLPPYATSYSQSNVSETIEKMLSDRIIYLDVTNKLLQNNDKYIFYRTDHHWTPEGAYIAYKEICANMGFEPLPTNSFDINTESEDFNGTFQSKLNIKVKQPDIIDSYKLKETYGVNFEVQMDNSGVWHNGIFYDENLAKKDKYTYYLDGNHASAFIRRINKGDLLPENNTPVGKNLLIIKDSYAHNFVPFIACHFNETHMLDIRYFNYDLTEYISEHSIDTVLFLYSIPNFSVDTSIARVAPITN